MSKNKDSCSVCKPPDFQAQLFTALKDKNIILFSNLLEEYNADDKKVINPDHQHGDPHYATCLELACKQHDSEDFVIALLTAGADPNLVNPVCNKAPLHITTECGNYKAINALLQDSRTDINIQDNFGCTALHLTAKNFMKNARDMERCVAVLMTQSNIKINKHKRKGCTLVNEAVLGNCRLAVEAFLRYGKSNIAIENKDRQSGKTVRELIQEKFPNLDLPPSKPHGLSEEEDTEANALFEHLYFKQYHIFKSKLEKSDKKLLPDANDGTLRSFLDDCLESNGKFRRDDKYELTFKYGFLEPPTTECSVQYFQSQESGQLGRSSTNAHKPVPELYPLHYISKSQDLRPLLTHPVLLSFLHLKWNHI
jgi:hypothetical protein